MKGTREVRPEVTSFLPICKSARACLKHVLQAVADRFKMNKVRDLSLHLANRIAKHLVSFSHLKV